MQRYIAIATSLCVLGCQPAQQGDGRTSTGATASAPGATPAGATTPTPGARDSATLALDHDRYRPGATVNLRITNHTRDTLGYNACTRGLERQTNGNWAAVAEPGRMCTMELRLLMPNETQTAVTELPDNASSGTYRIVVGLSRQKNPPPGAAPDWGAVRALSPSFRVE